MNLPSKCCNGQQQWQELFDEKVSKVYTEEPLGILKNLSMIWFTMNREMKKIQDALHGDVLHMRNMVIDSHVSSESDNKPSSQEDMAMLYKMLSDLKQSKLIDSMEPVPNESQTKNVLSPIDSHNNISTIDCESSMTIDSDTVNSSPELKSSKYNNLKKKIRRKRKLDSNIKPTKNLLRGLTDVVVLDDSSFKENYKGIDASLRFFKQVEPHSEKHRNLVSITPKQPQNKVTPRKSEDFDVSVIQGTPVLKSATWMKKGKSLSCLPRRKNEKKADLTLTQMIMSRRENAEGQKQVTIMETNCDNSAIEKSSTSVQSINLLKPYQESTEQKKSYQTSALRKVNGYSKTPLVQAKEGEKALGITMMVDLLNENSTKNNNTNFNLNTDEIQELSDSIRYDFDKESSLNSGMLEVTNIDSPEDSCQNLNDFLAAAQAVPVELQAPPVIRGKARQKLPGWTCKECEKFYTKQGLGPNEILALNKCTKHRGMYKPREDTLPGYWDMDLQTPE